MASFTCPVVEFKLEEHPNADSLSIARVKGWTCVVRTEDFTDEKYGVYIPIDAVAPKEHPLLGFLGGKRVRTAKLRGIISQGVLLPYSKVFGNCPFLPTEDEVEVGLDIRELLGVSKYVPRDVIENLFGKQADALPADEIPDEFTKYTDIERYNDYPHILEGNEDVYVTEKLHGTSARYGIVDGKFFLGTRNLTLRQETLEGHKPSVWHVVAETEKIFDTLQYALACIEGRAWPEFPDTYDGIVFYGEIVGRGIQDLHYGHEQPAFYLYDIKVIYKNHHGLFLDYSLFKNVVQRLNIDGFNLRRVPKLYVGPLTEDVLSLRSGKDTISNSHLREGIVIKPIHERRNDEIGRVVLKFHSEEYLLRKNPKDR